ncbi:hypothetical protein [Halobacillus sp. A5]|uniref:hypothetical protein n=1 Tax=Halobacillus sp. A5 TaxID=2880263 RepID=UPI0020A66533|nr:hypothetical protein [Halobacillus sp. A5]MCP3027376.1 hypothetical protein [Halobacillus sp. A5]
MSRSFLRSPPVIIAAAAAGILAFFFTNGFFIENLTRSLIIFILAPSAIIFANTRRLWFLHSFRWLLYFSRHLLLSLTIFILGGLLSYELLHLVPSPVGFVLHLIILPVSSLIYWAPLLVKCAFHKPREYSDKMAYFSITSALFFIYHQAAFLYYDGAPTLGFMIAGLTVMLITLLYLFIAWHQSEKQIDRPTVEGYVRSVPKQRNS